MVFVKTDRIRKKERDRMLEEKYQIHGINSQTLHATRQIFIGNSVEDVIWKAENSGITGIYKISLAPNIAFMYLSSLTGYVLCYYAVIVFSIQNLPVVFAYYLLSVSTGCLFLSVFLFFCDLKKALDYAGKNIHVPIVLGINIGFLISELLIFYFIYEFHS